MYPSVVLFNFFKMTSNEPSAPYKKQTYTFRAIFETPCVNALSYLWIL